jgi:ABC-type transport system substrate-binding protein
MLKDVGVDVELINHSSDVFFAGYADKGPIALGQYDIEEHSTVGSFPDPDFASWLCKEVPSDANPSGTNNQFFCDKDLDALFNKQATTVDPAARTPIFFQISQLVNDKVYWSSMWNDPDWWAVSKNMQNVKISGATMFWNSYEWDIK